MKTIRIYDNTISIIKDNIDEILKHFGLEKEVIVSECGSVHSYQLLSSSNIEGLMSPNTVFIGNARNKSDSICANYATYAINTNIGDKSIINNKFDFNFEHSDQTYTYVVWNDKDSDDDDLNITIYHLFIICLIFSRFDVLNNEQLKILLRSLDYPEQSKLAFKWNEESPYLNVVKFIEHYNNI